MKAKRIFVSLTLIFFSFSAFSQIDSTYKDSIEEIIIYEYDTIYIQPDTIRITDTIFDIIKKDSLKVSNPQRNRKQRSNGSYSMKGFLPRSIGLSVMPFMSLNPQAPSDTLNPQLVFNMAYHFQLNYYTDKFSISYGMKYIPYHEQFRGHGTSYSSNQDTVNSGSYDSLLVNNNYQVDYYYHYLCLDLIIGRKFIISKKLELNLNLGVSVDFLIGYKQGNTAVSDSMIRKTDFSLLVSPQIIYKINKKLEFKFSPYYQHAILKDKQYPYLFRQRAGIEAGFNFVF